MVGPFAEAGVAGGRGVGGAGRCHGFVLVLVLVLVLVCKSGASLWSFRAEIRRERGRRMLGSGSRSRAVGGSALRAAVAVRRVRRCRAQLLVDDHGRPGCRR